MNDKFRGVGKYFMRVEEFVYIVPIVRYQIVDTYPPHSDENNIRSEELEL